MKRILKQITFIFFAFTFTSLFFSCEMINPPEMIPSYIKIDSIPFTVSSGQGTSSSIITDAWVYIDDQPMGCYELPAKFPVLQEGNHKITVYAGISVNGISGTRGIYPFYQPWTTTTNLVADSVVVLHPSTTYYSVTKFAFIEDFEDGGMLFEKSPQSDTMLIKTSFPAEVFEGTYSGVIALTSEIDTFECKTTANYNLPISNAPVFVELNYKCNNAFTIGIYSNFSGYTIRSEYLSMNASTVWKKMYINITSAISRESTAFDYKIFISARKASNVSNGAIFLDNIKLVHNK